MIDFNCFHCKISLCSIGYYLNCNIFLYLKQLKFNLTPIKNEKVDYAVLRKTFTKNSDVMLTRTRVSYYILQNLTFLSCSVLKILMTSIYKIAIFYFLLIYNDPWFLWLHVVLIIAQSFGNLNGLEFFTEI